MVGAVSIAQMNSNIHLKPQIPAGDDFPVLYFLISSHFIISVSDLLII